MANTRRFVETSTTGPSADRVSAANGVLRTSNACRTLFWAQCVAAAAPTSSATRTPRGRRTSTEARARHIRIFAAQNTTKPSRNTSAATTPSNVSSLYMSIPLFSAARQETSSSPHQFTSIPLLFRQTDTRTHQSRSFGASCDLFIRAFFSFSCSSLRSWALRRSSSTSFWSFGSSCWACCSFCSCC